MVHEHHLSHKEGRSCLNSLVAQRFTDKGFKVKLGKALLLQNVNLCLDREMLIYSYSIEKCWHIYD